MQISEHIPLMQVAAGLRELALQDAALAALPAPEQEAAAFAYVLEHLPVAVHPGEALAGDWHWHFAPEPLREAIATVLAAPAAVPSEPSVLQLLDQRFHLRAAWTEAHTCPDYAIIIDRGLAGVLGEVEAALESGPAAEQRDTLEGMRLALRGVIAFAHRLADLAAEQGLEEASAICRKVPEHPSETVREALQALLLTYFQRGGLQVQVNGVGAEELREAIAEPQAHGDLIVRIAGYSARFTDLGRAVQEEMVERFEAGL